MQLDLGGVDIPQFDLDVVKAPIKSQRLRNLIAYCLQEYKREKLDLNWDVFIGGARIRQQRAKFLQVLLKQVKPQYTLELGSGATTQIFSRYVGKKHWACEHHDDYYKRTVGSLKELNLLEKGEVLLLNLKIADGMYDISEVDFPSSSIDVLLIDGPPLYPKIEGVPKYTRKNTLPSLMQYLAKDSIVLFDSCERPWEQECLQYWVDTLGVQYESPFRMKGLGVIDPFPS